MAAMIKIVAFGETQAHVVMAAKHVKGILVKYIVNNFQPWL